MDDEVTVVEKGAQGQQHPPEAAGLDEVKKLGILLGAEPGMMRHVARRIVVGFGSRKATQIHGQELCGPAQPAASREDKLVGGALVQGKDGERVEQPAMESAG